MFRRAMKRAMQNAMRLGIRHQDLVRSPGRLNGIEIARTGGTRRPMCPCTLRAASTTAPQAKTTYGVIGVKVWAIQGRHAGAT